MIAIMEEKRVTTIASVLSTIMIFYFSMQLFASCLALAYVGIVMDLVCIIFHVSCVAAVFSKHPIAYRVSYSYGLICSIWILMDFMIVLPVVVALSVLNTSFSLLPFHAIPSEVIILLNLTGSHDLDGNITTGLVLLFVLMLAQGFAVLCTGISTLCMKKMKESKQAANLAYVVVDVEKNPQDIPADYQYPVHPINLEKSPLMIPAPAQ